MLCLSVVYVFDIDEEVSVYIRYLFYFPVALPYHYFFSII